MQCNAPDHPHPRRELSSPVSRAAAGHVQRSLAANMAHDQGIVLILDFLLVGKALPRRQSIPLPPVIGGPALSFQRVALYSGRPQTLKFTLSAVAVDGPFSRKVFSSMEWSGFWPPAI